jgi:type VI protein secretion system component Hcp
MKRQTAVLVIGIGLGILGFDAAQAQGYVKFDGIDGEVAVEGYVGWSEFSAVFQKIAQNETTRGINTRVEGIPEFQKIVLVKPLDKASLKISDRALRGASTERVEIEWVVNFGETLAPYYRCVLEDVTVVEFTSKGLGEVSPNLDPDGPIKEQMVLDFERIKVTYSEYDEFGNPQGNVEYEWRRP